MVSLRNILSTAVVGLAALLGCSASVGPAHRASAPPSEETVITRSTETIPPETQPGAYREPDYRYDRAREDRIPEDARAVGKRLIFGEPADSGLFYEPRSDGRIFVRDE